MILIMGQKFKFLLKYVPGSKIVSQEIVSELMRKTRGAWRERRPTALPRSRPSYYRRVCHWLFCWIPSCIPDSLLQPDYARHVKFCVLSLSGSRFCLVTQRCWGGALRDKTQLLLWESTIQTSQTWINFVGMHFGIESDTSRNIHPNYKLGISGKSGFYVSDWRNSITHSFVSYIISAAMISWSRFYSWWLRS